MASGRREGKTGLLFIATADLPRSAGLPFYSMLNELLVEARFDRQVEEMCEPHYAAGTGRPSVPPGVYFRILFVGYFEGIDSQRGIAWRCSDSIALREFLGVGLTDRVPDHSTLMVIRKRVPTELHESVYALVLRIGAEKKLLVGKTLGVDAMLLEANAAMKSIVRKDTGEDWKAYLTRLSQDAGIENPTDDDLRRFDKGRGSEKKVSNADWESSTDPDSRITKMKDGRTHLAYKAEHAVDFESQIVLAATIQPGVIGDTESLATTLADAQAMLATIEHETVIQEIVADKDYHSSEAITTWPKGGLATYFPPKKSRGQPRWEGKTIEAKHEVEANDERARSDHGKALTRLRGERVERTFAHICDTGGARRSWLRGFENVTKCYLMTVAARNLGRILLAVFGVGKPKRLQVGLVAMVMLVTAFAAMPAQLLKASRRSIASIGRYVDAVRFSVASGLVVITKTLALLVMSASPYSIWITD